MVVDLPLSKIWVRQMGWLFPIHGKIKLMFQTTNQLWSSVHFLLWTWQGFPKKIFTKRNSSVRLRLWVCPSAFSPGFFRPGRRLTSGPSNSKDYAWPWSNSYRNKISKNHWVFHLYKGCNMLQLNIAKFRMRTKLTQNDPFFFRFQAGATCEPKLNSWIQYGVPHGFHMTKNPGELQTSRNSAPVPKCPAVQGTLNACGWPLGPR